jgi:hypothetical protein
MAVRAAAKSAATKAAAANRNLMSCGVGPL